MSNIVSSGAQPRGNGALEPNIAEAISDGFVTIDENWRIKSINGPGLKIVKPLVRDGIGIVGQILWDAFPDVAGTPFGAAFRKSMHEQVATNVEAFFPPLDSWFDVRCYPLVKGLAILFLDIGARKRAEDQVKTAYESCRLLVERSPFGVYTVDADFRLMQVSAGAQKVFENVKPLIGRDFAEVLHTIWPEEFANEAIGRFRNTLETGLPYRAPGMVERRADVDETEAYDWMIERLVLHDGRPGVVCHFYDLSERQRHDEHVQTLMSEVNHRGKNMLALVQAMARQTAASNPHDFVDDFEQRIRALASAQDLLVKSAWNAVPLRDLINSQLAHFDDRDGARIKLNGPAVHVAPSAAQTIGMAIYELATNAGKYGALSNNSGHVEIDWRLSEETSGQTQFNMTWTESGGPQVLTPVRQGFGSKVTGNMIKFNFDGEVDINFAPTGLAWRLSCPADKILKGTSAQPGE